ncbi:MAG: transcriptional regulator [Acidimicrobiales bacterium]
MAHWSDPRLLVLHGLRLKGVAGPESVADAVGLPVAEVAAGLRALESEGSAVHRDGPPTGWSLTPAGRAEHARLVAREVDATGARDTVASAYERFRALNTGVLDACSRWQVRELAGHTVRNDHRDPAYDRRVVADLAALHRRAERVVSDLAGALERFRPYGAHLARAIAKVEAGEGDWFTKPLMPSYHTVWFELHEDLLTTLGIDRTAEAAEADAQPEPASKGVL